MSASKRPRLARLADRLGIVPAYFDLEGRERRASAATQEALCVAMGSACSTEAEAEASLAALDAAARAPVIEPVRVWREHACGAPGLRAILPPSFEPLDAELELACEDGSSWRGPLRVPAGDGRTSAELALPVRVPTGVHALRLHLRARGERRTFAQTLIVAPRTALLARERLGDARALGLWTSLYTVRSRRGFGFGDFTDLARLEQIAAELGTDFVAINPLHALYGRGDAISPYSPKSRIWQNVLYLDVEAVPELAECDAARARLAAAPLARLRAAHALDYEAVLDAKLEVLRALNACFARREREHPSERGRAFATFRARAGRALEDFASFEALQSELGEPDWRRWPAPLRDPRSAAVGAFAASHARDIDFHAWLQFELDAQLERTARAGREAGLALGLVKDLAIGSAADSADAWANPGLFAHGATLGAPPDAYAADGQDWGLPPLVPERQREQGYAYLRQVLRSAFRSAGALRIDHVIGLARLFWIPAGRPGSEGAYVRQPHDELFGILALESRSAGALVIGEDLGTVPPELGPELASWGILSTRVLCFERKGPRYRASRDYPARALVLATTHDLPPLAGYLAGRDLELREALDGSGRASALPQAKAARAVEREALVATLRDEGDLSATATPADDATLGAAVNAHLARTPARLVAIGLDDLAGETEPLNLPGVSVQRRRSWSRRMQRAFEEIAADPRVRAQIAFADRGLKRRATRPEDPR
ncbi:MAG: 4-alpha-glucanotransferase [Myxococcota bacterium]